jgi:hypothetical protein
MRLSPVEVIKDGGFAKPFYHCFTTSTPVTRLYEVVLYAHLAVRFSTTSQMISKPSIMQLGDCINAVLLLLARGAPSGFVRAVSSASLPV